MRVLNFGSLNIDYVYQVDHFVQPGETLSSEKLQVNCGGKGLNQSIALARAGVETWHAGYIGKEGLFLREKLEDSGVHTQFVEQVSGSNGHAIIQVDPSGQNSILLHAGSNGQIDEAFVDRVLDRFSSEDVVLLQNETSCVGYILEQAARRGMRVALNAAPANSALLSMPLERLTWLLVNEVEGAVLAGQEAPEAIVSCLTRRYPRTMLVLTLGTGLGAGIILDGRLRGGESSSEAGHMVLHAGGEPCPCGRRGCWEQYASATALIRRTEAAMAAHPESALCRLAEEAGGVDGRTPFLAAEAGDETALAVCRAYVEELAEGTASLINILRPEAVAFGGGVAGAPEHLLLEPLRRRVGALCFSRHGGRATRILRAELGNDAGVIGAALLGRVI